MNKKIFRLISAALAAVTLISAAAIPSMAAAPDLTVKVDGKVIDFPDQEPTIVKDRTLVPVRFIAENLGYDVEWDVSSSQFIKRDIDDFGTFSYFGTDKHQSPIVKFPPLAYPTHTDSIYNFFGCQHFRID